MPRNQPPQTEASRATRFQKGNKANPNGRPKKLPSLDRLLLEVLGSEDDKNSEAKQILQALKKRAKAGDKGCAELLLNRAYGIQQQDKPVVVDNNLTIRITRE